ncbi:hypothetical protein AS181_23570 [Gordonia sp. SGD-V-85]|nr:hypothetical protein AS181_23570 [Gordonia sp. SGD-V-85]
MAIMSDHCAGGAVIADHRAAVFVPRFHSARQIVRCATGISEGRDSFARPSARAAHHDQFLIRRVGSRIEIAEAYMDGVRGVAGCPFVVLADIDQDGS